MLNTINVSEKGQIAIPREIQESLGIKKGDRLVITAKDKKILIQKATSVEKHVEDNFHDLLRYSESSLEKLWNSSSMFPCRITLIRYSESSLEKLWNNKKDDVWEKYL